MMSEEITQPTETVLEGDPPAVIEDADKLRASLEKANREAAERRHAVKALQAELAALKSERDAAATQAMTEQGKFKELYEAAEKRAADEAAARAELEQRIKAQETALLRQRIATEKGLPAALVDRLQGETPEELAADADVLLAALPRPNAPALDGGTRGAAGRGLSPQDAKAIANRFNIDPRYLDS
jgi:membrane protein involved in colicin uptake